ncbi:hypothetical protein A8V01_12670 [Novosphingobium guangzhouense]|uniref:Uncharacterized protein n=1 Tax=Novosphingobium guangzhouense TaxID=1850347 RepID=A0A2K2G5E3_9SPHN|nr:hypothetical protein A8V01_12670 [Novosphingobium guangzhouense]
MTAHQIPYARRDQRAAIVQFEAAMLGVGQTGMDRYPLYPRFKIGCFFFSISNRNQGSVMQALKIREMPPGNETVEQGRRQLIKFENNRGHPQLRISFSLSNTDAF